jgi:hypothetical protein
MQSLKPEHTDRGHREAILELARLSAENSSHQRQLFLLPHRGCGQLIALAQTVECMSIVFGLGAEVDELRADCGRGMQQVGNGKALGSKRIVGNHLKQLFGFDLYQQATPLGDLASCGASRGCPQSDQGSLSVFVNLYRYEPRSSCIAMHRQLLGAAIGGWICLGTSPFRSDAPVRKACALIRTIARYAARIGRPKSLA